MIMKIANKGIYCFSNGSRYGYNENRIINYFKTALDKFGNMFYYSCFDKTLMFWKYLKKEKFL